MMSGFSKAGIGRKKWKEKRGIETAKEKASGSKRFDLKTQFPAAFDEMIRIGRAFDKQITRGRFGFEVIFEAGVRFDGFQALGVFRLENGTATLNPHRARCQCGFPPSQSVPPCPARA
jgi:hypothetical protein